VRFFKGHGTGNDFVILPDPDGQLALTPSLVASLCDRHRGIGADGVLRVVRAAKHPAAVGMAGEAEWFMDYWNADGSMAEMCGNGVRVFARFLVTSGYVDATSVPIATRSGVVRAEIGPDEIAVSMPVPRVLGPSSAVVGGSTFAGTAVDVGNPHLVCVLPPGVPLADLDLGRAPAFDEDLFPAGVNVEFLVPGSSEAATFGHIAVDRRPGPDRGHIAVDSPPAADGPGLGAQGHIAVDSRPVGDVPNGPAQRGHIAVDSPPADSGAGEAATHGHIAVDSPPSDGGTGDVAQRGHIAVDSPPADGGSGDVAAQGHIAVDSRPKGGGSGGATTQGHIAVDSRPAGGGSGGAAAQGHIAVDSRPKGGGSGGAATQGHIAVDSPPAGGGSGDVVQRGHIAVDSPPAGGGSGDVAQRGHIAVDPRPGDGGSGEVVQRGHIAVDRRPAPVGVDAHVAMRVYERGSGETLSCGSGAIAVAAVALRAAGKETGVVAVDLPGGRLTVTLDGAGCVLTGPAVLVATGETLPA